MAIVRDMGAKVVVLDQRMPQMDGTELGQHLVQMDARIRRILLSGEARADEVTQAYDSGFVRHVHKNQALARLPAEIGHFLLEWHKSLIREVRASSKHIYSTKVGSLLTRSRLDYYLLGVDAVNEEYSFDDSWIPRARVDTGAPVERTVEIEWTRAGELQFEAIEKVALEGRLEVKAHAKLETALSREISHRVQHNQSFSRRCKLVLKKHFALPPEPRDPGSLHVKARSYEVAPIYVQYSLSVLRVCSCCHNQELLKAVCYLPSGTVATRHVDYYSNGEHRTVLTGIEQPDSE